MELAEARTSLLDRITPLAAEEVELPAALGRVGAVEYRARWDWPSFDLSPVDGYAVRAGDLGRELRLRGGTMAGDWSTVELGPGEAWRVATGAPIPTGADTVVPQELTELDGELLRVTKTLARGSNFRPRGEEIRAGDPLIGPGTLLTPGVLALLASQGYSRVEVRQRPRAALLVTGDEVRPLGAELRPGQIYDSNRYSLGGLLREAGAEIEVIPAAPDREEELVAALASLPEADLYLTTGGVSVGPRDFLARALAAAGGEVLFHGLALRPGSPTLGGWLKGRPFLGLSGNPAAAVAGFHLLAKSAVNALLGRKTDLRLTRGRLTRAVEKRPARVPRYLMARAFLREAVLRLDPVPSQSAGSVTALRDFNAYFIHPAGTERLGPDEEVEVLLVGEVEISR